jgi:hypothetical protein
MSNASKQILSFSGVLSALLVAMVATRAAATVDIGPLPWSGHTYYVLSPDTWTNAEAETVFALGGHRLSVVRRLHCGRRRSFDPHPNPFAE